MGFERGVKDARREGDLTRPFPVLIQYFNFKPHRLLPVTLDLDVDPGGQIEFHQRIDRLLSRFQNVDEAFMRSDLEMFPRLFVDMGRTENAIAVNLRRKRDRTSYAGSRPS